MRLVDADEILKDIAFCPERQDDFEPDPVSGETLEPIPVELKRFYREILEREELGIAETVEVALVVKRDSEYEILKVLK